MGIFDVSLDPQDSQILTQKFKQSVSPVSFKRDTNNTLLLSLRAYYQLEDNKDVYGNVNLTNNNSVTFVTGKIKNGAYFGTANSNKYLSTTNVMGIDGGEMSVSMWVLVLTAPAGGVAYQLFYQENTHNFVDFNCNYHNAAGTTKLFFDREKPGVGGSVALDVAENLGTNTWNHVVARYDGAGVIEVYLNGASIGTTSGHSGNGSTNNHVDGFSLASIDSGGNYASVMIDEVGVWSKQLSLVEIADLYNNGLGQTLS